MARTIQQITADIETVQAQAAIGDTAVRNADGSEVQSRSEDQRRAALAALQQELSAAVANSGAMQRRRVLFLYGRTGY